MRISDKVLIAVVLGLLIIAGVSLLTSNRQAAQDFQSDTTPTGVTTNYIRSIQAGEYERAYGYLSPQLPGYPKELKDFIRQVNTEPYLFDRDEAASYQVLSVESRDDWAIVQAEVSHFSHNGLFSNDRWSTTFTLELELIEGEWRISGGDRFIAYCWTLTVCPQ